MYTVLKQALQAQGSLVLSLHKKQSAGISGIGKVFPDGEFPVVTAYKTVWLCAETEEKRAMRKFDYSFLDNGLVPANMLFFKQDEALKSWKKAL